MPVRMAEGSELNRRDFFARAGFGSYSLIVLADAAAGQTATPEQYAPARPDFARIAPPQAAFAPAEPHMRLVNLETDVLVAGGGLAGVCAAIAAARHGAKVVLLQDRSRLGGNSSSEVKMHVVGANQHTGRPGWRESGLRSEEHTSELQSPCNLVCRLLLEKKKKTIQHEARGNGQHRYPQDGARHTRA